MPEILTDAYLLFTFVFKQALKRTIDLQIYKPYRAMTSPIQVRRMLTSFKKCKIFISQRQIPTKKSVST